MTQMTDATSSADGNFTQNCRPYLILRQSRVPVDLIHVEDDQDGRRILVETMLGERLLVTEGALEACRNSCHA
ncbi:hypothetical protein SAMN07250955_10284 [Arboricoccus pini]|uniref:Uncharacterized protein n=1 Tax=Arboricoccus pini TaxID=1963835 RepID=A0A212QNF1_9PROT|nr:hypothetical protein [Arboricoccus pini]SNB60909.1 hypothetical protein SAMN07250955_10284 [Arboricoccus pini]